MRNRKMRKVVVSIHTTLDGFATGPRGDENNMDWLFPGVNEAQGDLEDFLRSVDTMLLGRVTYEGFAAYWPGQSGEFADWMNETDMIVFSRTPREVAWAGRDNITLIHEDVAEQVARLKAQQGRDMVTLGSGGLVQSLTSLGLIDEGRLVVHPVVLGSGNRLFGKIARRRNLELLHSKRYEGGAVLLHYGVRNGQVG
jgi:dihydrofolate reductase